MSEPMLYGSDPMEPACDVCICGQDIIWDTGKRLVATLQSRCGYLLQEWSPPRKAGAAQ